MPNLAIIASSFSSAVATSYESIATSTTAGDVTFTSIPSTFQHLQLRILGKNTNTTYSSVYWTVRFNGDTGNNYDCHSIYANGSSAGAMGNGTYTNQMIAAEIIATASPTNSNNSSPVIIDILDYKDTTKNKVMRSIGGFDSVTVRNIRLCGGLWMNTSAITSVTIIGGDSQIHAALYGIKAS